MESIDWSNLSFGYMPTDYNVRCIYKDGKWGDITVTSSQTFEIHMAATCLHYGQPSLAATLPFLTSKHTFLIIGRKSSFAQCKDSLE